MAHKKEVGLKVKNVGKAWRTPPVLSEESSIPAETAATIAIENDWDRVIVFAVNPGQGWAYQSHGFYGDQEIAKLLKEMLYTNG